MYVDVVFPLPLAGVFTYRMPSEGVPVVGMRVLAPFGKKKIYAGVIVALHTAEIPDGMDIKEIICCLDDSPVVTPQQLRLWHWVADYYMCTLGEVMKAALPAALKLESETRITLVEDVASASLSVAQQKVCDFLSDGKQHTIDEIGQSIGLRSVLPVLNKLIDQGMIQLSEHVEEKYRPKTADFVLLTDEYTENEALQALLSKLNAAKKQLQLLLSYLELVRPGEEVSKHRLLQHANVGAPVLKALTDKQVFSILKHKVERLNRLAAVAFVVHKLNAEQSACCQSIQSQWKEKEVVLLHGVTSSGKTEVYISLIQQQLAQHKQVLYLVPEIALTTQLTDRLQAVFGDKLGVYHSKFSDAERAEIYRTLLETDRYQIILGVRSSVFLPFRSLGMVIVDEEHDSSYKQQDPAPRYHARNVAIVLAQLFQSKVLLGTATPAIETYYNAQTGKYGFVEMLHRYAGLELPDIGIVDTKEQYRRKEMTLHFSDRLIGKIADEIEHGKQVIVFQNRRGYAPYMECKECAYVPKCVNCDVSLTLHQHQHILQCHYCGYTISVPDVCPACGNHTLIDKGFGTEKIEDELQQLFPATRIARMDLDTTRNKNAYRNIINDFAQHKTDILVGTQMVSKGLHFDEVSLVAVVNADNLMNQPDFRAYEKAFQMLEQVSGRAGRKGTKGKVIIQTSQPDNRVLRQVVNHDYKGFYLQQLQERSDFRYPPFYRLISVTVRHRDAAFVQYAAEQLQAVLHTVFAGRCSKVVMPAISKMQNFYIRQLLLKIETNASYAKAKRLLQQNIDNLRSTPAGKGVTYIINVDPQ